MKQPHKNLAAFSAILGLLVLILAVAVLAEKSHEGHLPERNDRGTNDAPVAAGILAGAVILLMTLPGSSGNRNSPGAASHRNNRMGMSCCPAMM
jgi:hypothetical protein